MYIREAKCIHITYIIPMTVMFTYIIVAGCINSSKHRGEILSKGEIRRALALSFATFYFITTSILLFSNCVYIDTTTNNNSTTCSVAGPSEQRINVISNVLQSLHYLMASVFGFYFGFRILDNWVKYKAFINYIEKVKLVDSDVSIDELLKKFEEYFEKVKR
jgi:hypothetical protein